MIKETKQVSSSESQIISVTLRFTAFGVSRIFFESFNENKADGSRWIYKLAGDKCAKEHREGVPQLANSQVCGPFHFWLIQSKQTLEQRAVTLPLSKVIFNPVSSRTMPYWSL